MGWASGLISQRTFRFWAIATALVMGIALAGGIAYGNTASCTNTAATLTNSAFEVDTDANLVVNNPGCVDWLTGGTGTGFRTGVTVKNDTASGSGDESFGNGTKEDTAVPSIVTGGIPPNKSDLKAFGVYTEQGEVSTTNPTGKYLALFWTRVQDPSGTTNMDFELNQSSTKSANGVTPVRTNGDLLITYDLSNGGTNATISKRTWLNGAWSGAQTISPAKGSINTSLIQSNQAGTLGSLDPRTFGEAIVPFNALFGTNTCGQFGSAYLKSRSSDQFTAALKDFVPPAAVSISNCASLTTNASNGTQATAQTINGSISDTATLAGVSTSPAAGGTITFKAFGPDNATCTGTAAFTSAAIPVSGPGTYNSGSFTPLAVGTYRWTATYSGDASNQTASSPCNAANETSIVVKANPAISTSASNGTQATAQTINGSISDTATLSGATTDAGGTITFHLFSSLSDCQNSTNEINTGLTPATVSGNGQYSSGNFTPTAVGTYYWVASYSGDSKNEAKSGQCGDANESSVVGKAASKLDTEQSFYPNDSATLSADAGGTPSGSVTFSLFDNSSCTGTALIPATSRPLNNGVASTNNTSVAVSTSGTYYWKVEYAGDDNHKPVSSCTENTDMQINNGGQITSQ